VVAKISPYLNYLALITLLVEPIEADRYPLLTPYQNSARDRGKVRPDGTGTTTTGPASDVGGARSRAGPAPRPAAAAEG